MTSLIGISFDFMGMTYYQTNKDINLGDTVIVSTPHGTYPGKVSKIRKPLDSEIESEHFLDIYPEILRIATFSDLAFEKKATIDAEAISKKTQEFADSLSLNMKVLKSYLDIDGDKLLITFISDSRVDFRELIRLLTTTYHQKIELRQIGPRDQAKLVGGIGSCGLPLCCATFLKQFDGISISMAKNQLLSINIPKLSGQCGKLLCCLKYEDEAYSKLRPLYPKIGDKFNYNNKEYEVSGLNLLTDTITTYNGDNYESFTKDEFERVKKGLSKVDESKMIINKDVNAGVDLSGHGILDTNIRLEKIEKAEKRHQEELKNNHFNQSNKNNNKFNNKNNNNRNNNNFNKNNNKNHSFNNNNNRNNNHSFNKKYNNHNNYQAQKKDSGFIPVSQISDKSILDFNPGKKNDKE